MKKEIKVLVLGPAGIGKTTIAQLIHDRLTEVGLLVDIADEADEGQQPLGLRTASIAKSGIKVKVKTLNVTYL